MQSVSSRFSDAQLNDVDQIASKVYLVLGNYASSPAYGSTVSASGSDGSGNYPASGAIDGDRTELNVGPASTADNDIGLSSWRSAVAPSVTPQTLTIDFGTSRTINRFKLYHLSSHGLSSYKVESSPDNVTYTLMAKTTDQGGTIATTGQLDVVDFTEVTCRYVKLTIANTVVAADKANVVELEIYRLVDISDYVQGTNPSRDRDYKLGNPLAATLQIVCDNADRYFSPSHTPSAAEVSQGFVNSELKPNIGIICQHGFAFGGGTPELVTVFVGYVDKFRINPSDKTCSIEARDYMKPLINNQLSSKLKTSIDIAAAITYALNLVNISTWETSIATTGITLDYYFLNNESVLTSIRNLVQGAGDALFFFNELGIATFVTYLGKTPQSRTESTTADFDAGTVKTNIDTSSVADRFGRKWFLLDDFADGNFNSNPVWTNHVPPSSYTDTTQADFEAGTVKTNIATTGEPGTIKRNWFTIDSFLDNDSSSNPAWTTWNGTYQSFPPQPTNRWTTSSFKLTYTPSNTFAQGRAQTPFTQMTGTWEAKVRINDTSNQGLVEFFFIASGYWQTTGPRGSMSGYCVRLSRATGLAGVDQVALYKVPSPGTYVELDIATMSPSIGSNEQTIRVTRDSNGAMVVYVGGVAKLNATNTDITTCSYVGVQAQTNSSTCVFTFDDFYYAYDVVAAAAATPTTQAIFESRVFDQSAQVLAEGLLTADYEAPSGAVCSIYTATSPDGVSFDPYVLVTSGGTGGLILSTTRRYIKYKILFFCPADSGTNANVNTVKVNSVTFNYTVVGWQCVTNALKYLPGTSGLTAGIDMPFVNTTGTWRCALTLTNGTGAGMAFRMYVISTGYDSAALTYLSGYYAQVDQANGKLGIYKISSSGSRTLLAETAQAINTSAHSLRLTRESSGQLTLYWDEVQKVQVTDTGFSTTPVLAFEVNPLADTNGNAVVDDVIFSPAVDGTGATSSAQAVFESDVIDLGATVSELSVFQAGYVLPVGTSLAFYTATSTDGTTFDAYVATSNGGAIVSAVKRYLKYKIVLTCPADGGTNGNVTTPQITDVTINWFTGTGSNKYPATVSFVFEDEGILLDMVQEYSDVLGGDSAILNYVAVQAKPLVLAGAALDTQWQGTVQTPPVPISAGNPLSVTNGQTLTYQVVIPSGMDISLMSGASPAAAAITFSGGGAGSWVFSRIHPTRPVLVVTITGTGNITDLRVVGKGFANSTYAAEKVEQSAASIAQNGLRPVSISNPYIVNSAIADLIALRLLSNYKDPISYVPSIKVCPIFSGQLGDRVTIKNVNSDVNSDYIIIGMAHTVQAALDAATAETEVTLLKVVT